MAKRANVANDKIVQMFVDNCGVSTSDAKALAAYYRREKLVKIDKVAGGFVVTHGRLLSDDVVKALLPMARKLFA